jgi:hypothetical protein
LANPVTGADSVISLAEFRGRDLDNTHFVIEFISLDPPPAGVL